MIRVPSFLPASVIWEWADNFFSCQLRAASTQQALRKQCQVHFLLNKEILVTTFMLRYLKDCGNLTSSYWGNYCIVKRISLKKNNEIRLFVIIRFIFLRDLALSYKRVCYALWVLSSFTAL